ncbi:MAG: hypothetical protein WBG86_14500 [Polyangiales bacterium]
MNQLDMIESIKQRESAVKRSDEGANPGWKDEAYDAVMAVARARDTFTSDHVWQVLGEGGTRDPRALGPVMRRVERDGYIAATDGWALCLRPSRHRAPVRVWRSLVRKGGS